MLDTEFAYFLKNMHWENSERKFEVSFGAFDIG